MIGQIGHFGKVSLRVGIISSLLYTLGMTLGAAIIGAALGTVGLGVRWIFDLGYDSHARGILLVVALAALIGGLRDLRVLRLPLPQPFKQVPFYWLQVFGPYKTGFLWGLFIGLAFSTMIGFSLYYVLAFWVLLIGQPLVGATALAIYGLTQGLLLLVEMQVITAGVCDSGGLFGSARSNLFYRLSGVFLLGCAALLFVQTGLLRLP